MSYFKIKNFTHSILNGEIKSKRLQITGKKTVPLQRKKCNQMGVDAYIIYRKKESEVVIFLAVILGNASISVLKEEVLSGGEQSELKIKK